MRLDAFDYSLPSELIARDPAPQRDQSRLMILDRQQGLQHHRFRDLVDQLVPGDLLVLNDVQVVPALLELEREDTGGRVELLYLAPAPGGEAIQALARPARRLRRGIRLLLSGGPETLEVVERVGRMATLSLPPDRALAEILEEHGRIPLPPYIRQARREESPVPDRDDRKRYQTTFARTPWAVAAPTAGLHFTPELLDRLRARGCRTCFLTLRIGWGTFRPIEVEEVEEWSLESEEYRIPPATWEEIIQARGEGRRVVAVGTTVVRALEAEAGEDRPGDGQWRGTDLFIRPGHCFRIVDALVTNFHLPRSSLLLLVGAFGGIQNVMGAYREAVRQRYRFYSYGDAMLIR